MHVAVGTSGTPVLYTGCMLLWGLAVRLSYIQDAWCLTDSNLTTSDQLISALLSPHSSRNKIPSISHTIFPFVYSSAIFYVSLALPQRLSHVSTVNSFLVCRPQETANARRGLIHLSSIEIASVSKQPDETHSRHTQRS